VRMCVGVSVWVCMYMRAFRSQVLVGTQKETNVFK